ncbi:MULTISPECIES: hypothetical protein [Streptacidiphilus]|uniref:Uncharacterized protein n=1 Tax=Streptacidiphilus cavernicola TaxID=3342716 RepID=A0ABV6UP33_9ACTN|nr:hypothetical protein [Streptacidiphilus jeojiense]
MSTPTGGKQSFATLTERRPAAAFARHLPTMHGQVFDLEAAALLAGQEKC